MHQLSPEILGSPEVLGCLVRPGIPVRQHFLDTLDTLGLLGNPVPLGCLVLQLSPVCPEILAFPDLPDSLGNPVFLASPLPQQD